MDSKVNLSGFYEFNEKELNEEIERISEEITDYSNEVRRLYCLRNLLLDEKEKQEKEKHEKE